MINKIYRRIYNNYSTLFKFIFFLRYLLGVFFTSIVLFLLIPHFYDFKKKDEIIQNYLLNAYGLKLNKYENIKYNSIPVPNLKIKNADMSVGNSSIKMNVVNLSIYPKLISIYNFQNFEIKKIVLE